MGNGYAYTRKCKNFSHYYMQLSTTNRKRNYQTKTRVPLNDEPRSDEPVYVHYQMNLNAVTNNRQLQMID